MKVYIDLKDHSKDGKCSGFEKNIFNRLKYLKVTLPGPSRFFLYDNVTKVLTTANKHEILSDPDKKVLIDSCSEWSEIETYIL